MSTPQAESTPHEHAAAAAAGSESMLYKVWRAGRPATDPGRCRQGEGRSDRGQIDIRHVTPERPAETRPANERRQDHHTGEIR